MLDDNGAISVFDRLRYGPRVKPEAVLYGFDLLELDGEDLRRRPIKNPKAVLKALLFSSITPASGRSSRAAREHTQHAIHYVEHLDMEDGALVFQNAGALGYEGIVSKLKGSRYMSGRTRELDQGEEPARTLGEAP